VKLGPIIVRLPVTPQVQGVATPLVEQVVRAKNAGAAPAAAMAGATSVTNNADTVSLHASRDQSVRNRGQC